MAFVLVVDDDVSFRFFLKSLLELEGHEVAIARNAAEGMGIVTMRTPDLITLDVMMPEHGGLQMYRTLASKKEWRQIPVVMLSGVSEEAYIHALAINRQSDTALPRPFAYLEKPPAPEKVLNLVRSALTRPPSPGWS